MRPQAFAIAVRGTGSAGGRHIKALRALPGVEPIAVPVRATQTARLRDLGFRTAGSLAEAVEMGAGLAIIATETGRHVRDALEAVDLGLSLLVEKPLAPTARQADQIRTHADAAGRQVFVGCVLRFSRSLQAFRAALNDLGAVHTVRIESQSYLPDWRSGRPYADAYSARAQEGGVLLDLIHELDYAAWCFGWPDTLQATLRNLNRLGIAAEEAADVHWLTPTGVSISITLDYLTRPPRRWMRAAGERGTLEWDAIDGTVTMWRAGDAPHVDRRPQGLDDLFAAQASAFTATRHGTVDPHLATVGDGIRALALCDAARVASHNRCETPVVYS